MQFVQFVLDTPTDNRLNRVTRFGGWCLSDTGEAAKAIRLSLNGLPMLSLMGSERPDVAAAFPKYPFARRGGFVGDLVLPDDCKLGDELVISIEVELPGSNMKTAYSRPFIVREAAQPWPTRARNYDLASLLEDPYSGVPFIEGARQGPGSSDHRWSIVAGTPHFHPRTNVPAVRLLEQGVTNPWGDKTLDLISELQPDKLFLDFGAGIKRKEELAVNVVLFDALHFPNVDIVSTAESIPFKSGSFDLVISQAVFEHLPNPIHSASEILRVLKPGAKVLIDTAFMAPFHADPNHYFNMTIEGLRRTMKGFDILELGVQPYQMPSDGLTMQLETVLPLMQAGTWRQRLRELLELLRREGRELDRDLGPMGQHAIAGGVSVVARKPL